MIISGKPAGYAVIENDQLMDLLKCQQGKYGHSKWSDVFSIAAFLDDDFQEESSITTPCQMKPGKLQVKLFGGPASAPISPSEILIESEFGVEILAAHDLCKLRSVTLVKLSIFTILFNFFNYNFSQY